MTKRPHRLSATRSFTLAASVAASVVAGSAGIASAALPVFAGPGGPSTVATGFRDAAMPFPSNVLNNAGTGVAITDKYASNISLGYRSFRWTPGSAPAELGSLASSNSLTHTQVLSINSAGVIVGSGTKSPGGKRAVRYAAGSISPTELGTLQPNNAGVADSGANDVNNLGVAVGYSSIYSANTNRGDRGVVWPANSTAPVLLNNLTASSNGTAWTYALHINDTGNIAGVSQRYGAGDVDLGARAVRWASAGSAAFELDPINTRPDGFATSGVYAISPTGVVVGVSHRYAGSNDLGERPVRWNTGGVAVTELGILGTDVNGATTGVASAINAAGTTTGWVNKFSAAGSDLGLRAVRWNAGSADATELGNLGTNASGQAITLASSINSLGTISGSSTVGADLSTNHAVLWLPGTNAPTDLNTLIAPASGWALTQIYKVSDTGFVAGIAGYDPDGAGVQQPYLRAFSMLVPQAGTYGRGDANFDTKVDFSDLVVLAQHYGQANAAQNLNVGDLDLNGSVDFNDLVSLAQHYGGVANLSGFEEEFAADWTLAQSLVPEPGAVIALVASAHLIIRRRRLS